LDDPFRPIDGLTIECVSSPAGSGKTYSAVAAALKLASDEGAKILIVMPTLEVIREFVEFARRPPPEGLRPVPVVEITSGLDDKVKRRWTTTALLQRHIRAVDKKGDPLKDYPVGGHLVFASHETFWRMPARPFPGRSYEEILAAFDFEALFRLMEMGAYWPPETAEWHVIIDEAPEVVLTRQPFRLHDNAWVLSSFLETEEVAVSPLAARVRRRAERKARDACVTVFTKRDMKILMTAELIVAKGEAGASKGEVERAHEQIKRLRAKKRQAEAEQAETELPDLNTMVRPYFAIKPKQFDWLMRRVSIGEWDDVYGKILEPVPRSPSHSKWAARMATTERVCVRRPRQFGISVSERHGIRATPRAANLIEATSEKGEG
jgi:hypothetical protein